MRRRVHRSDGNQSEIVKALRAVGCAVYVLGQPVDLLCFYNGLLMLVEVKNPDGLNRLTKAQKEFRATWPGPWYVVHSVDEALELVGVRKVKRIGTWE